MIKVGELVWIKDFGGLAVCCVENSKFTGCLLFNGKRDFRYSEDVVGLKIQVPRVLWGAVPRLRGCGRLKA